MTDTIEFLFDIASPYSYLASTQIDDVASRCGVDAVWRPFLLGAVFKATGNDAPAMIPAKGAWMLKDLQRWAEHYDVPFSFNHQAFPPNSLRVQRALAALDLDGDQEAVRELASILYGGLWVDGVDVTKREGFTEVVDGSGLDAESLWARAEDSAVKEHLREITDRAIERGAFGAPTFFVGDEMYWGNDRLEQMEARLATARG